MIGVGMPGINDVEGRTQYSLWCILGAPLFLGTDARNMTAATKATLLNAEAVAINQGASVQATQVSLSSGSVPAPTPFTGGLLLNLTDCGDATQRGTGWRLDAGTSQLVNLAAPDMCSTIVACDTTNASVVFAYQCVTNQCSNEKWKMSGSTIVSLVDGAAAPLCLTGVDPASAPQSQLIVDVCDGRPEQQWTADAATGQLRLAAMPAGAQCLTLFAPPLYDVYAKPMDNGDVAVALLNRGSADLPAQTIDLAALGYAPKQLVTVRDVWAAATSAPLSGSYTSRPIASHETILLRIANVVKPAVRGEL